MLLHGLDSRVWDGNRVVAAAGAERQDIAPVVAAQEAELVLAQRRKVQMRFRYIGHGRILTPEATTVRGAVCRSCR